MNNNNNKPKLPLTKKNYQKAAENLMNLTTSEPYTNEKHEARLQAQQQASLQPQYNHSIFYSPPTTIGQEIFYEPPSSSSSSRQSMMMNTSSSSSEDISSFVRRKYREYVNQVGEDKNEAIWDQIFKDATEQYSMNPISIASTMERELWVKNELNPELVTWVAKKKREIRVQRERNKRSGKGTQGGKRRNATRKRKTRM